MAATLGIVLVSIGAGLFALRMRQRRSKKSMPSSADRQSPGYDLRAGQAPAAYSDPRNEAPSVEVSAMPPTQEKTGQVLALSVMSSPGTQYEGYELLQALLTNGLRFGERGLFHRYAGSPGSADILFSLASVKNPGIFDLPKMGEFKTPGLMLFMECDSQLDSGTTFEMMKSTALRLVETLGGHLCDQNRQPISRDELMAMTMSHEACLV